jgi:hypothetical protein
MAAARISRTGRFLSTLDRQEDAGSTKKEISYSLSPLIRTEAPSPSVLADEAIKPCPFYMGRWRVVQKILRQSQANVPATTRLSPTPLFLGTTQATKPCLLSD